MSQHRLGSRPSELPGMRRRPTYAYASLTVLLLIVVMGLAAWLVSSVNELHGRFARESRSLGLAFLVIFMILLAAGAICLTRWVWHSRSGKPTPAPAPADVIQAAAVQAEQAEGVIRQVADESAKAALNRELGELRAGREHREFHVVVFGTGSAGK